MLLHRITYNNDNDDIVNNDMDNDDDKYSIYITNIKNYINTYINNVIKIQIIPTAAAV